jgi:dienelactone hydrolase
VTFRNSADHDLTGFVVGTGTVGVLFANQYAMRACSWHTYAKTLAQRGYRAMAFDFDSTSGGTPVKSDADVASAARYLRGQGVTTLVLIGGSRGGTAVLSAATMIKPAVAGVVSISAPAAFDGMDALAAVAGLTVPVLYLAGAEDTRFADDAERLFRATPGRMKQKIVLEGPQHGEGFILGSDPSSVKAQQAIAEFLNRYAKVG